MAVSGENVAFVLILAGPLLRRLPRFGRLAAGIVVLVVFGTMTRWEPSVLRACAMAACSLLALSLGRPTAGLRALALAAIVLLLADPIILHTVFFRVAKRLVQPWVEGYRPNPLGQVASRDLALRPRQEKKTGGD